VIVHGLKSAIVTALSIGAIAAGVVATPAAAETVTRPCHGTCGAYMAYDDDLADQGAVCVYNRTPDHYGDLLINNIKVRPPQMSGSHADMTPVAWRFRVQDWQHGIEDSGFKRIIHTSTWQTSSANTTHIAYLGSGFTWRSWAPTQDPGQAPLESYRVFIDMRWSYRGSVRGTETIRYDWYREKKGTSYTVENTWCGSAYPDE
jgi:hypothetical protein